MRGKCGSVEQQSNNSTGSCAQRSIRWQTHENAKEIFGSAGKDLFLEDLARNRIVLCSNAVKDGFNEKNSG
jgi:hypothetical protein